MCRVNSIKVVSLAKIQFFTRNENACSSPSFASCNKIPKWKPNRCITVSEKSQSYNLCRMQKVFVILCPNYHNSRPPKHLISRQMRINKICCSWNFWDSETDPSVMPSSVADESKVNQFLIFNQNIKQIMHTIFRLFANFLYKIAGICR